MTTKQDEIPFRGHVGWTYKFFSMAVDKAGNIEAAPEDPLYDFDTETTFVVGMEEIEIITSLDVFPNPATDRVTCRFNLLRNTQVSIRIYNVYGEETMVVSNTKMYSAGDNTLNFSIEELPVGVYTIKLDLDGTIRTTKIVKS
jgi:hypothetical protein